jgi:hypothetical protein
LAAGLSVRFSSAQTRPFGDDLKRVTANGKVENNVYHNPYVGFRLALPQPSCEPTLNASVDEEHGHAVLLNCVHVVKGWEGMYTLTISLDYRANYPSLLNVEHYVRSLRHAAERDPHEKTVRAEESRRMQGLEFVQAILSSEVPEGIYYQGIACTQMKAYLLCFKAEAPSTNAVEALLNLGGKLQLTKSVSK